MEIIPAVLEADFIKVKEKLDYLVSVKEKYKLDFKKVQIDFCDGVFIENRTWLPTGELKEKDYLATYGKSFDLEYHLMCQDEVAYFKKALNLQAAKVIVHIDEIFKENALDEILFLSKKYFIKLFITASLDFLSKNRAEIMLFLKKHESVGLQIMGIDKLGKQGQAFDPRSLELVTFFRGFFSPEKLFIQIDGSVNNETLSQIKASGVNAVVVGSYLVKTTSEEEFVNHFKTLQG